MFFFIYIITYKQISIIFILFNLIVFNASKKCDDKGFPVKRRLQAVFL